MGALFLVTDRHRSAETALADARAVFAEAGFAPATERRFPGWRLLHHQPIAGGPLGVLGDGDDWVAVAGTMVVDGRIGQPALARLLDSFDPLKPDWSRLGGQFVAVQARHGRVFLFTDYLGGLQLFHNAPLTMLSTSLLAAVAALPRVSFDPQGLDEFAFNVVPIGDDTVLKELKTLGPERMLELTPAGATPIPAPRPLPGAAEAMPLGERLERHQAALHAIVGPHVRAFADHIQCPLSGGLDSRLLLAALRREGARPSVYVYGPPGSADVTIAQAVGAAQGFPVTWINKEAAPIAPDAFPDQVARNFVEWDGLPNFGVLFDNGGHAAAREARHAGGALAASGGAGEVYRDFFYLPDRPLSARTVARSFFARFARRDATAAFEPELFLDRIARKIAVALGTHDPDAALPRGVIEQAYPRVRSRALFGREISLEARQGAYLMPFLDQRVVGEALRLPMRLKQAGRFEAALLTALDPSLAREPSAYGHHFAEPPSRRHRFGEWSTRIRPAWLRQHSYALQRRLRPAGDEHGGLLTRDYMDRVIDPEFPLMRPWFDMDRIADSGLWRRVACLEYFAERLGGKLAK
jgi:asparagine synthetase B (glutamine-hydrolysing)